MDPNIDTSLSQLAVELSKKAENLATQISLSQRDNQIYSLNLKNLEQLRQHQKNTEITTKTKELENKAITAYIRLDCFASYEALASLREHILNSRDPTTIGELRKALAEQSCYPEQSKPYYDLDLDLDSKPRKISLEMQTNEFNLDLTQKSRNAKDIMIILENYSFSMRKLSKDIFFNERILNDDMACQDSLLKSCAGHFEELGINVNVVNTEEALNSIDSLLKSYVLAALNNKQNSRLRFKT